ncbi:holo-ACP synthase [Cerasibacillus sp. JNUCC 74]
MILGIGMDLVEVQRLKLAYNRTGIGFVKRIIKDKELKHFYNFESEKRKLEWLAGRLAAKEAVSKAIGTGIGKTISFHDIEVHQSMLGKPELKLNEKVTSLYSSNVRFCLTITHTENVASAFVIIEDY